MAATVLNSQEAIKMREALISRPELERRLLHLITHYPSRITGFCSGTRWQ
jgi:hypothetical protein